VAEENEGNHTSAYKPILLQAKYLAWKIIYKRTVCLKGKKKYFTSFWRMRRKMAVNI